MQELTFRGFLARHVRDMSYSGTNSIRKLVAEAVTNNGRLQEPLFLYALFSGKQELLLEELQGTYLYEEFFDLLSRYDAETMTQVLADESPALRREYHKAWRTYQYFKNRSQVDAHTKGLIRQKVLQMQKESGVSNYRICKDLGLSVGNINRWLKHGECGQVSLEKGWKIVNYLRELQAGTLGNENISS